MYGLMNVTKSLLVATILLMSTYAAAPKSPRDKDLKVLYGGADDTFQCGNSPNCPKACGVDTDYITCSLAPKPTDTCGNTNGTPCGSSCTDDHDGGYTVACPG